MPGICLRSLVGSTGCTHIGLCRQSCMLSPSLHFGSSIQLELIELFLKKHFLAHHGQHKCLSHRPEVPRPGVSNWSEATRPREQTSTLLFFHVPIGTHQADGASALSVAADHTSKTWDTAGGVCKQFFTGHTLVSILQSSRLMDHQWVPSSVDKISKIWDTATEVCKQTFTGHIAEVKFTVFLADGSSALSASADHISKIWDTASGACKQTFTGHTLCVNVVVFSADGSSVLSASADHIFKIWDTASGFCKQTFTGLLLCRFCSLLS